MAERAVRPKHPDRDIVELDKDERWQARLAEARARREVALREKAGAGEAPKRRAKPWEAEAQAAEPDLPDPITPDAGPRPDFSDRMQALRRTIKRHGDNGGPPVADNVVESPVADIATEAPVAEDLPAQEATFAPPETPARRTGASVAGRYLEALSPEFKPEPPFVPEAHGFSDAPSPSLAQSLSPLTAGTGVPLRRDLSGAPDVAPEARPSVEAADDLPRAEADAPALARKRVPALLLAAICVLSLLPFTDTAPPMEIGPPVPVQEPGFGLVPALGLMRPMNAFPRQTVSWEWLPELNRAASGPFDVGLAPPAAIQREVAAFGHVEMGAAEAGVSAWSDVTPLGVRGGAGILALPSVDPLPGVSDPREVPRPPVRPVDAASAPLVPEVEEAAAVYPEPLSLLRVTILLPSAADPAEAEAIAEDVLARGHELAVVKPVDLKISESNVRYFHGRDRGEAERLANAYSARLRDFTSFRPKPNEGTVEVWLAGQSARAAVRPRVTEPVEVAVQPTIIIVQRQQSLLDRLTGALGGGSAVDPADNGGAGGGGGSTVLAPVTSATGTATGGTSTGSTSGSGTSGGSSGKGNGKGNSASGSSGG